MGTKVEIRKADPKAAYDGSWYFVAGCGGDLNEWVDGYTKMLEEQGMGKPIGWYQMTGAEVNAFAGENDNPFPDDLTCLLFPLDDLHVGKLAMFKIRMQDRWFDDVIDNMRTA
jgi:hypothetical protein